MKKVKFEIYRDERTGNDIIISAIDRADGVEHGYHGVFDQRTEIGTALLMMETKIYLDRKKVKS